MGWAYLFYAVDQQGKAAQCPAGTVDRILVQTPWMQPVRNAQGQTYPGPDYAKAWESVRTLGLPLAQCNYQPCALRPFPFAPCQAPALLMAQHVMPSVGQVPVAGAVMDPIAASRQLSAFPVAPPKGQGGRSDMEIIPDCGLPRTSDPLFGDEDGTGGTFTEIDSAGNEYQRGLFKQPGPPPNTPR